MGKAFYRGQREGTERGNCRMYAVHTSRSVATVGILGVGRCSCLTEEKGRKVHWVRL